KPSSIEVDSDLGDTADEHDVSNVAQHAEQGAGDESQKYLKSQTLSRRKERDEAEIKETNNPSTESTAMAVSLQVKFLHKVIQEWFAAKHLALLFSTKVHHKYQLLSEHLENINPTDLHYVLRFTCHLCPRSFHFISRYFMKSIDL
ncbi:hypothetical protein, partial [Salmonella sp. s54395]|uniref:hypothetical protein n=1 Tax=Salmonella sp. s54395 TaxID=3159664 RepID=UPI00397E9AEA